MSKYEPWNAERASVIIAAHKLRESAALPIMHALQHVFGWDRRLRHIGGFVRGKGKFVITEYVATDESPRCR